MATALTAQEKVREPVEQFVTTTFYHGVPIDLARQYDSNDVRKLIDLLNDSEQKEHWGNILWVLGAIGDERALDAVLNFTESRFKGAVDGVTFNAIIQGNLALGLLGNRNTKAADYVTNATSLKFWNERDIDWQYKTLKDRGERDILLTQLAINSLPLTAKLEVLETLTRLRETIAQGKEMQAYFGPNIEESIERYAVIQSKGLRGVLNYSDTAYRYAD